MGRAAYVAKQLRYVIYRLRFSQQKYVPNKELNAVSLGCQLWLAAPLTAFNMRKVKKAKLSP
jgi:hypothetical protein